MTLEELKKKWGTWMAVANELKIAQNTVKYWRRRGSIPYNTQCAIQNKTKGVFKARREDDIQPNKESE